MIDCTTAGYTPDHWILIAHIFEVDFAVDALVFAYHDTWGVDVQHDHILGLRMHLSYHIVLYGCIDIWVAVISMVYQDHVVNIVGKSESPKVGKSTA